MRRVSVFPTNLPDWPLEEKHEVRKVYTCPPEKPVDADMEKWDTFTVRNNPRYFSSSEFVEVAGEIG